MRKLSCNILALSATLAAVPAGAQSVSSFSVAPDTVVGGHSATASVVLSEPVGAGGAECLVFSLGPTAVMLPERVTLPPGAGTATFPVYTLPIDTPLSTFVGLYYSGATHWARLTVLNGHPFRTRLTVFRSETGQWFLRDNSDGSASIVEFGRPGDEPLPTDYLEGNGLAQLAVFRRGTREWLIRRHDGSTTTIAFGEEDDIPAPGDYVGVGRAQIAMLRPKSKELLIRTDAGKTISLPVPFAEPGDQPVSGNYLGQERGQFALFRPRTYEWLIRREDGTALTIPFGQPGDVPVPADYLGSGRTQIAVCRRATGEWFIRADNGDTIRVPFGAPGDIPVQGDYLALRRALLAVFRPDTREWLIRTDSGDTLRAQFGGPGDVPVPNFYAPRFALQPPGKP